VFAMQLLFDLAHMLHGCLDLHIHLAHPLFKGTTAVCLQLGQVQLFS
jgi:hypothetical protein